MNNRLTIYQEPSCTTCKKPMLILKEARVNFNAINYYVNPLSREKLKELLKKMNARPRDILRTREEAFRKLNLAVDLLSDDTLIDLMASDPDLLPRPIIERSERAVLSRPPERIRELF